MPVFLPTTLQGADQIIQTMKDLKKEAPSNTMEVVVIVKDDEKPGDGPSKCAESCAALLMPQCFKNSRLN